MAARTLYPDRNPMGWSPSTWAISSGGTPGEPKPDPGDTVLFDHADNNVQMDEDSAVLLAFTLADGTLDGSDGTQWELYVDGNVTYTAGTARQISLTQGTGTLAWNASAQPLLSLTSDTDETVTLTAIAWVKKYTGTGNITGAAQALVIYGPSAAWWGTQVGTVGCPVYVAYTSVAPGNDVTLADVVCRIYSSSTNTIAMDANLDTGTGQLSIYGDGTGDSMILDMVLYDLTCGTLTLGDVDSNGKGVIDFGSGDATITEIVAGNAANRDNEVDFGTGDVTILTAFDSADDVNVLTSGACTITVPSITLDSNANNSTTWTFDGNTALIGDLTLQETAGTTTINTDGYTLGLIGDLTYTAGTVTELIVQHFSTGNLYWNTQTEPITEYSIHVTGVITTITGHSYVEKLTVADGAEIIRGGSADIYIWKPGFDDCCDCGAATIACEVVVMLDADRSNSGTLKSSRVVGVGSVGATSRTLTQTGLVTAPGKTEIMAVTDGYWAKMILSATGSDLGAIYLGNTLFGWELGGKLELTAGGQVLTAISVIDLSGGQASTNAFDLTDSVITWSGVVDGDSITITSTGANFMGAGDSAEIKDVTSDAVIHCWGMADGAGNNEYVAHESSLGAGVANVGTQMPMAA